MGQNSSELHHHLRITIDLLSRISVLSKLVCNHVLPDCLVLRSPIRHHFKLRFSANQIVLNLLAPTRRTWSHRSGRHFSRPFRQHQHLITQHTDQSFHLHLQHRTCRSRLWQNLVLLCPQCHPIVSLSLKPHVLLVPCEFAPPSRRQPAEQRHPCQLAPLQAAHDDPPSLYPELPQRDKHTHRYHNDDFR